MMGRPGRLVRGRGLPGSILSVWEPPMPFVPPKFAGISIFLYASKDDADQGSEWGGSGFLLGFPIEGSGWVHLYAVSNDHVIHSSPVIRVLKSDGSVQVVDGLDSDWIPHCDHDDVAIRPLGIQSEHEYGYVAYEDLLSEEDLEPNAIGPGDDCLMVGRYINHEGRQFDRPVIRFGNLAMLPEAVRQKNRGRDQESFLVDMRSQPGFSGSPVFVYYEEPGWRNVPGYPDVPEDDPQAHAKWQERRLLERDLSGMMGRTWLLGIDWGQLPIPADVYDVADQKIGRIKSSSGMAAVVPAWKIRDVVERKGVTMARQKDEEQLRADEEGAGELHSEVPDDEFGRFENLTRKLVNTPKPDKPKDES
jgi:hypothetical protein